ncbi:hypothetical protein DFO70_10798 [Cytobacillus firmus]|uniref:Uncharacterized protein n=2 Tax=Cytobacillus TaxID=2675230 RepID=A0A366JUP9_CYTFI|nr:hypothetical protein DFO70_10798 [Cytobacillus firmus]TDX42146.1 hypothetical protein DFO72_107312 [Cytobacillus oceanisediminis]
MLKNHKDQQAEKSQPVKKKKKKGCGCGKKTKKAQ